MYQSNGLPVYYNGQQVIGFPFLPNYTKDFLEVWEWKTDVLTAFDGSEQRLAIRDWPRRHFEFEIFCTMNDRSALENYLYKGLQNLYAVPCWNSGITLTASTLQNVSTNTIPIEATDFNVGYVIGFLATNHFEVRQAIAVDYNGVTLDREVSWPPGTIVYPAAVGYLKQQQMITRQTGQYTYATVVFDFLPFPSPYSPGIIYTPSSLVDSSGYPIIDTSSGTGITASTAYEPLATNYPLYKGYPILEEILDASQGTAANFNYKAAIFDPGSSGISVQIESLVANIIVTGRWMLMSKTDILRFLAFITERKGRLTPFWLPTYQQDMIPVSLSGYILTIQDIGFSQFGIYGSGSHSYLRIVVRGQLPVYCQILSKVASTDGSETEVLTLDTAFSFSVSQIVVISFMTITRMDTDRIEINYKGPTFATVSANARTLNYVV